MLFVFIIGSIFFKAILKYVASSLATPLMLRQSPLLAVSSISISSSFNNKYSLSSFPSCNSPIESSSTIIPSSNFGSPISVELQIIPFDSTPLNLAFLILKLSPKTAPTVATATY